MIGTTNSGTTWQQKFNGVYYSFDDLYFFDSINGLAFGTFGAPASGAYFKTSNGGITWETFGIDLYPICCFFTDTLNGWCGGFSMSGNSSILKTTDGGNSWIYFPSQSLDFIKKIKFFDNNNGWVLAGSNLYKTSNAGLTWNPNINSINDFCFVDESVGWYVSMDKIFKTTNAGLNWILQHTNDNKELYNIFFKDINCGWACGDSGLVLRTINSGIPVELTYFTSTITDKNVTLIWQTATETNNQGFQIDRRKMQDERSDKWNAIGFVNGNGTTTKPQSYSFVNKNLPAGKYQYRLKQIDFDGTFEYSNAIEVEINSPIKFSLSQNYPNPFNPSTKISWQSPISSWQTLKVYDILGNEVATLVDEYKNAGSYEVEFKSSAGSLQLASGIYYYQLKAGDYIETKKMILLK